MAQKLEVQEFHPVIWWIWAALTAIGLVRSGNLLISCATVSVVWIVVILKSEDVREAPWVASFYNALRLGVLIVIIRVVFGFIVGVPSVGRTVFTLPEISLPTWMAGIRIGGQVTEERVIATFREGIMLAAIIAVLAAASSLTNPHQLLRSLPIVIYEFGVAVVIATTLVPQLVISLRRIRDAQRLRGQSLRGVKSIKRLAVPLLEESLSRSLDLAAAMDSRGYGMSKRRSSYRVSPWIWNEYVLCTLGIIPIFSPRTVLLFAFLPIVLAPSRRTLKKFQPTSEIPS